jgi:hypothetical protein
LTKSFKEVCPDMDHRVCVRHIYVNFRDSNHRGKALKDKLWAAASAYTKFEFDALIMCGALEKKACNAIHGK